MSNCTSLLLPTKTVHKIGQIFLKKIYKLHNTIDKDKKNLLKSVLENGFIWEPFEFPGKK